MSDFFKYKSPYFTPKGATTLIPDCSCEQLEKKDNKPNPPFKELHQHFSTHQGCSCDEDSGSGSSSGSGS